MEPSRDSAANDLAPGRLLKRAHDAVTYLSRLFYHCFKELMHDRAEEMAAALTYRTIFSLVPLAVLGLVVFRAFVGLETIQQSLLPPLYNFFNIPDVPAQYGQEPQPGERVVVTVPRLEEQIQEERRRRDDGGEAPATPEEQIEKQESEHAVRVSIQTALTELTAKMSTLRLGSIGIVGVLVLVYAALSLVISLEYDVNVIFKSPTGRPWHLRIPIHWSIITLGAGLLAVSLYLSGQFVEWVKTLGVWAPVLSMLTRLLAFLASWVLLFLLYQLMPNTRVQFRAALLGSMVAAILWEAGKVGFQAYVGRALPYSAFYGALGLIPLFLLWIYISWFIVLFGLELTYTLQFMKTGEFAHLAKERQAQAEVGHDPHWVIPLLAVIGRSFVNGQCTTEADLIRELGLSARAVSALTGQLEEAAFIHRVEQGDETGHCYTLARPPEQIRIDHLLELASKMSLEAETTDGRAKHPAWQYLDELAEAQRRAAGDATLANLVRGKRH